MRENKLLELCIRLGKWEKAKICIDNQIMFCNLSKEQVKELSDSIDEYKKNFVKEMDTC